MRNSLFCAATDLNYSDRRHKRMLHDESKRSAEPVDLSASREGRIRTQKWFFPTGCIGQNALMFCEGI